VTLPGWADLSRSRRFGHRLLGPAFPYLLHLRPAEWPIMAAHTLLGYVLAVGISGALAGFGLERGLFGALIWVVFLNGGTLAINSAFDQDEGDIGYLKRPPPPPRHLVAMSLGLLGAGQALAFLLPIEFVWAYAACFLLSVLYSVPPFRFKAVAGADWLINMWGFGTLTPYAGWAATGIPLSNWSLLVLLGFCPLFAALYPLTQLYQVEEDERRGDRTLVLRLGMGLSLSIAIGAVLLAFGLFGWGGLRAGWSDGPEDALRWGGLLFALLLWLLVVVPWRLRFRTLTADQHQRGMYRALGAWAVTDLVILAGFGW
jgi:lycopene elongase/hydratase (dihydrobisanhydrobacterioruberin-forming)